jgi:IS6 family transposase
MIKTRPALFKWRHFEPEIIVCAVRWYLRFSLSYRDVEELLMELPDERRYFLIVLDVLCRCIAILRNDNFSIQ